jgi:hypothetical protein
MISGAITSGTTLVSVVASWLHRDNLSAMIPTFVQLAEQRINADIGARAQDTVLSLDTVANTDNVTMPSDLINLRTVYVNQSPKIVLDYLSPDQFESSWAYSGTNVPQAYTIIGNAIYLAPTPDAVYPLGLTYKAKVPSLTVTDSNWLILSNPAIYLYATLCEAAPYLQDDARIQLWEGKYTQAVAALNAQEWSSNSTMRVRTDVR